MVYMMRVHLLVRIFFISRNSIHSIFYIHCFQLICMFCEAAKWMCIGWRLSVGWPAGRPTEVFVSFALALDDILFNDSNRIWICSVASPLKRNASIRIDSRVCVQLNKNPKCAAWICGGMQTHSINKFSILVVELIRRFAKHLSVKAVKWTHFDCLGCFRSQSN